MTWSSIFVSAVGFLSITAASAAPQRYLFGTLSIPIDPRPTAITSGDFNGDGKLDLAVVTTADVSIFLGQPDGTFQPRVGYAVGDGPSAAVVADFNGDGKLDIAVACSSSNDVSILLGNGDGTFRFHVDYLVGRGPVALVAGYFNAGGAIDLAVANSMDNSLSILLGNGDGSFLNHVDYPAGTSPKALVAGDINKDGKLDVAVAGWSGRTGIVSILSGNGDGTFVSTVVYSADIAANTTTTTPRSIVTADFNGDGKPDLAITGGYAAATVLSGDGNGGFVVVDYPVSDGTPAGYGDAMVTGDFNGDGRPDLATVDSNLSFGILLGTGAGGFQSVAVYGAGEYARALTAGDFNGDGKLDLAIANFSDEAGFGSGGARASSISIVVGIGDGTFQAHTTSSTGPVADSVTIWAFDQNTTSADLNRDNKLDQAVANINSGNGSPGSATVSVLLGNGNGTYQPPVDYPVYINPYGVTSGDFNGDGKLDLAVYDFFQVVSVLLGNGDGTFQPATNYRTGYGGMSLTSGDFNGDGKVDLALLNAVGMIQVMPGKGNGTFDPFIGYSGSGSAVSVAVAGDFNGDGARDFAVEDGRTSMISVFLNSPVAALYPSALAFGNQSVGTTSAAQTVLLSNPGVAPLTIASIVTSPEFNVTNTCGGTIASGSNCNIQVTFKPGAAGIRNGLLTITDNMPGSPQILHLTGIGTTVAGPVPTVGPVSPNSGSGASQIFQISYSDSAGYASLQSLNLLFNSSLRGDGGCWVRYARSNNGLYLENDAGSAQVGPIKPGASASLQNSQCTLNGAGSTAVASGNTITLKLSIAFKPAFGGAKTIYAYAADVASVSSGWQNRGTWTAPATLAVGSLTPNAGSGSTQVFQISYSDSAGFASLQSLNLLFNASLRGDGGCWVRYMRSSNALYLEDDAGTSLLGPVKPGAASSVQNGQCTLNASGSTVVASGTTITLKLSLTFKHSFAGAKIIYAYAADAASVSTGWQNRGTWSVP